MSAPVTWAGTPPEKCDICETPIKAAFVDGATTSGPWAYMCPTCHRIYGRGLGMGRGQKYEKRGERFVKTAG